jgi:hypothetical protein
MNDKLKEAMMEVIGENVGELIEEMFEEYDFERYLKAQVRLQVEEYLENTVAEYLALKVKGRYQGISNDMAEQVSFMMVDIEKILKEKK